MNKTITCFTLLICFFFWQKPTIAQNLSIDFIPPESFCSLDGINCTAAVSIPFSLSAEDSEGIEVAHEVSINGAIPEEDSYGTLSGVYPGYIISGDYPIGQHAFVVTAIQGMDTLVADLDFSVVDCVAPTVECVNGITVILYPVATGGCEAKIPITDFLVSTNFDCAEPLNFAIYEVSQISSGINPLQEPMDSVLFNCDLGETLILELYVWDNAFNPYSVQPDGSIGGVNYNYCTTYALLESFISNCCYVEPMPDLIITVKTDAGVGIEDVELQIFGESFFDYFTDENGEFEGYHQSVGPITITPHMDVLPTNGISTLDQILIQKHILGVQTFDSPYKMIAADVNNSTTISMADVIQLRKLTLGDVFRFF
jgi:hypothetical protein